MATAAASACRRRTLGSRLGGLTTQILIAMGRRPRDAAAAAEWRFKLRRLLRRLLETRRELDRLGGRLGVLQPRLEALIEELGADGPGDHPEDGAVVGAMLRQAGAIPEPPRPGSRSELLGGFAANMLDRRGLGRAGETVSKRLRAVAAHLGLPAGLIRRLGPAQLAELTLRQRLGILSWNALTKALRGELTLWTWRVLDPPIVAAGL
jgi:hypothetical protein